MKYLIAAGCAAGLALAASVVQGPKETSSLLAAMVPEAAANGKAWGRYAQLPMAFERNEGQTDETVKFIARGVGYGLFLTPTEAVLSLQAAPGISDGEHDDRRTNEGAAIRMALLGANPAPTLEGKDRLQGTTNYFRGDNAAKWRSGVERFARVRYGDVYPGIDLVYYGNQQQLEYDFIVGPGRDPRRIELQFSGIESLQLDDVGNLLLRNRGGVVTQQKPIIYQDIEGTRRPVTGRYRLLAENTVGFEVGHYDNGKPLVIDPIVAYSSYLGGSGDDVAVSLGVDDLGNLYVLGTTTSVDFPEKAPLQMDNGGARDLFVAKLNQAGNGLVYSTYLGGSGEDAGIGISVDAGGNVVIVGHTTSTDFPVKAALQISHAEDGGVQDAFVTKLAPSGSVLTYSTYLGGSNADYGLAVVVDGTGNAYVTGSTASADFPLQAALDSSLGGPEDVFVTKFGPQGNTISYSTFLGGSGYETAFGIDVDEAGAAYLTGYTTSDDFPVVSAAQAGSAGSNDAFVTKIAPSGSSLDYSTYLGGDMPDFGRDIAVDSLGRAVVGGSTWATTGTPFPTTPDAPQPVSGGGTDGFVTVVSAIGTEWESSTYLGGTSKDEVREVEVDERNNAYVTGLTLSTDFPGTSPTFGMQHANAGGYDAFVSRYHRSGVLVWSTYLGGTGDDYGYAIALYGTGNIFVAGATTSTDLPLRTPLQSSFAGTNDGFVVRLGTRGPRTLAHDFNVDLHGDILWRNPVSGANAIWLSANRSEQQAISAVAGVGWQLAGAGDFDGDYRSDILWRNSITGANTIWLSGNSATLRSVGPVTDQAWEVVGIGDFNGDFEGDDIFWRNKSTGTNAIWLSANKSTQMPVTAVTNLDWKVVGVGDFNGDFTDDVLWRNGVTGANAIWYSANYRTQPGVTAVTGTAWRVAGVGDFLGDGKSDILWRNVQTGANAIWRGGIYGKQQPVASVATAWQAASVSDYNGDGRSDILWRNQNTGANVIWRSGSSSNYQVLPSVTNPDWRVVP